jgi:hypothetical protein
MFGAPYFGFTTQFKQLSVNSICKKAAPGMKLTVESQCHAVATGGIAHSRWSARHWQPEPAGAQLSAVTCTPFVHFPGQRFSPAA